MTFNVDEFLDGYEMPTRQVPVCPRAGLLVEFTQVEADIIAHRQKGLAGAPSDLYARLDELEAEIEASVKVFTLTAVSHKAWADLLAAHPPTKDQEGSFANPDTFDLAALALCASDPQVTVEQAQRMRDTLPPSEWRALTQTVLLLNQERTTPPKSLLRSVDHLMRNGSSDTPQSEASQGQGSLAGDDVP